jgi:ankyrin repeat protein
VVPTLSIKTLMEKQRCTNIEHRDINGETALFTLSLNNSLDIARLLIDRGANIEHQDINGETALCQY